MGKGGPFCGRWDGYRWMGYDNNRPDVQNGQFSPPSLLCFVPKWPIFAAHFSPFVPQGEFHLRHLWHNGIGDGGMDRGGAMEWAQEGEIWTKGTITWGGRRGGLRSPPPRAYLPFSPGVVSCVVWGLVGGWGAGAVMDWGRFWPKFASFSIDCLSHSPHVLPSALKKEPLLLLWFFFLFNWLWFFCWATSSDIQSHFECLIGEHWDTIVGWDLEWDCINALHSEGMLILEPLLGSFIITCNICCIRCDKGNWEDCGADIGDEEWLFEQDAGLDICELVLPTWILSPWLVDVTAGTHVGPNWLCGLGCSGHLVGVGLGGRVVVWWGRVVGWDEMWHFLELWIQQVGSFTIGLVLIVMAK